MRKALITVLSLILLSQFSFVANAQVVDGSFPDVPNDHKYAAAIEYFHERGIIEGYSDSTFRPDQPANRAEALKIILLSSDVSVDINDLGDDVFPDVTSEDWFYAYIKKAVELDIVEGYDDGYFRPVQNLNIAETLKIILLTNGVSITDPDENDIIFPDVTGDLWFAPYAAYSKAKNIIEPQADGNLNAGREITRGELVELMYRTEIVLQNDGEPFEIDTNWPTVTYPEYAFKTKLPFDWKIINNEDQIVFWHPDTVNHQSTYEVPYPFSADVKFHLDQNEDGISKNDYIQNLEMVYKSDFGTYQKNTMNIAGYETINLNASPVHDDYYVFYPNNKILQIYTAYGWSNLTDHLEEEITKILDNVEYVTPQSVSSNNILSEARDRILVEGVGQQTLDLFDDLVNIETDTIGVGTGPIDYFYSEQYDVTFKYERSSDTILDIQNSETTAF